MARVAVIGEQLQIYGYRLAGAVLCPAAGADEAVTAWRDLADDIAVAVLTPAAARWLAAELGRRPDIMPVLLPGPGPGDGQDQGFARAGGAGRAP